MRPGVRRDESLTRLVSLVISSCVWCCTMLLNAQPLVQARPQVLGRYKRESVDSFYKSNNCFITQSYEVAGDILILVS